MTMETREKTFCLVAIVIGLSSLALMIGTPSLPWMIQLSQVISISIILFGMVAELIFYTFVICMRDPWKIDSTLFFLMKFLPGSVIRTSSKPLINCISILDLILLALIALILPALIALMLPALILLALIICTSLLALIGTSSLAWVIHISHVSTSIIFYLLRRGSHLDPSFPAESFCKIISKITSSDKPKSSVYSKNERIGLGLRTSLSFFFELCFPELALAIDLSKVSICISLFGMVALADISLQVRVKKHGQGQSSSGQPGESGAGNGGGSIGGGGDENGTIGHGTGQGRLSGMGGGGQGRGNDDDDDNDAGRVVGNLENGRRPRNPTLEEIATIFLPIIIQSIANIMSLNGAELSTSGRVIRYLSMIINSVGFICCAAVLWEPYSNSRVARILNPRITGFFSRIGSALAVLGFISMMSVDLPLYPSLIMGLAFLLLLLIFLMDISEALQ